MISTRNLSALPSIPELKRLIQSLAVLDAIIEPQWEYRYYSLDANWGDGEQMASMRNGSGDEWFCVFSDAGAFLKGFDHESPMSPWKFDPKRVWPSVLDQVPDSFQQFAVEPAFSMDETTFCCWRTHGDSTWHTGQIQFPADREDPDGSQWMLSILDGDPQQYHSWAESYYERTIPLDLVEHVYQHKPITHDFIRELNPDCDVEAVLAEIAEIGYPG